MTLPEDIVKEINHQFPSKRDNKEVVEILSSILRKDINVGEEQLARGILIIADGDLDKIKQIFSSNFYGDPRDLLMEAHSISSESHYGINKFISK